MTIKIVNNGDGTFTASSLVDDEVQLLDVSSQLARLTASNVLERSTDIFSIISGVPGAITWDTSGDRRYETGLDRGVLYLPDGSAVPWNGLISIIEHFDAEANPVYYDGMKINDVVALGNFSATLRAFTYPDEFLELEGFGSMGNGVYLGEQNTQLFGLSYRTLIGNDVDGISSGYKLHILYNLLAIPSDQEYDTVSEDPNSVQFEWNISATPEEVPGFRPTAHVILNSLEVDPWLLQELEEKLYGSTTVVASLMSMSELMAYIATWYRIQIIDNGNGTWTAISRRDELIELLPGNLFQINEANVTYVDESTFVLTDTVGLSDV